MTEFPEDSPRAREDPEAEDWLRRELAFLHGVERRVVRRARAREEAWRVGAVALIFVMFASCWYLAALSSSDGSGTACPVASSSVEVDSTVPAGRSGSGSGAAAGSGAAVTDASGQYQPAGTMHTVAQPGTGAAGGGEPNAGAPGTAGHPNAAKPGDAPRPGQVRPAAASTGTVESAAAQSAAASPGSVQPGELRKAATAHPGSARRPGARGPGHSRPGGTPRGKAVKPAGAGAGKPADPVKPALAQPVGAPSTACGI